MLTSASAQPLGVGDDGGSVRIEIEPHASTAGVLAAGGARRVRAERVDVAGRQLEADRPREVEHLVDDAVEPRHLLVDVGDAPRATSARLHVLAAAACAAPP